MRPSRISLLLAAALASPFGCSGTTGSSSAGSGDAGAGGEAQGAPPCPPSFADCDGDPTNGCEGALSTSLDNCGACGVKCQAADHQAPLCSAGRCIGVCDVGFADCNGNAADGCEVDRMSDTAHCGSCERSCKNTCFKGACDVLALSTGQAGPATIAIDDTSVYWANLAGFGSAAGSIMKVAKAGGALTTLADKQSTPWSIAFDAASVYWVNMGTQPEFTDGAVLKVPKDGSSAPKELAAGQASPYGVAVQGSALYWTTLNEVLMIDKDDPSAMPVVLAKDQNRPRDIVAAGTTIYWVNSGTPMSNPPYSDGSLMMLSRGGGAPVTLASNLLFASGLTLDSVGAYLYWGVDGAIMRLPLGGGPPEVFMEGFEYTPWRIAADAATVYWTEATSFGGTVSSASVRTRQRTILAPNQTQLWDIAIDQTSVYWTSGGDGNTPMTGAILKLDR